MLNFRFDPHLFFTGRSMVNHMLLPSKAIPQALLILSSIGVLETHSQAQRQQTEFWSNPDFVERFIGTYSSHHGGTSLRPDDKTFMEEFATLMQTNRQKRGLL